MRAWLAIPSARPVTEVNRVLKVWRARGYGVALWRDQWADGLDASLILHGPYPGYANAVSMLSKAVLDHARQCDWIVTAGDDTEPDLKWADLIADECYEHFGGTFGVMQPTGDRFAGGSIDRIAGSPWLGREWCQRANGGKGPLWPEFTHMFVDECLMQVAIKCGVFWQRPDLVHMHRHFMRANSQINAPARRDVPVPAHLVQWNTQQHWNEMQGIFNRLKSVDFAPCMPLA